MIKFGATALCFLMSGASFAHVTGTVTHKGAQPLANCAVSLGASVAQTGTDGSFTVSLSESTPTGQVQVSCEGFAPKFIEVNDAHQKLGSIDLKRPNFLLIVSDDHGWAQTSTQMDPADPESKSDYFRTPNIDDLLSDGMKFTRGYSPGTYCLPTRRSIQSSQSTLRHVFNGQPVLEWTAAFKKQVTIPRVLKSVDADYMTAHLGKWDHRFEQPDPSELGYDVSDGATGNGEGNVGAPKTERGRLDKFTVNPSADPKVIFDLTKRASEFIEAQTKADKPFFLQLSHYALHLSIFYKQTSYDEVLKWKRGENHNIPSFAAMLKDLDDGIGLLRQKLVDLGIDDNTYIIFMADNGGRDRLNLADGKASERLNYPLSVGKHSVYEGGIRVPFGMVGPGIAANSNTNTAVSGIDILPTLADIVGAKLDLDGTEGGSIKDVVYQQSDSVERPLPFLLFHDKTGQSRIGAKAKSDSETALLQGDLKLIKTWKGGKEISVEMYNVTTDKGEHHNLMASMPEKAAELGKLMDDYIADVKGDVTIDNDDWKQK